MKILAIETSAKVCSVAVCDENGLLGEVLTHGKLTHSEQLMPMVDQLLCLLNLGIAAIDLFAISQGPGSFTGLRIGMTTIKGFAYALQKPLVAVNTLEAMAYQITPDRMRTIAMMDARNQQVYCGIYRPTEGFYVLEGEIMALPMLDLLQKLHALDGPLAFVGDGSLLHRALLRETFGQRSYFPQAEQALQRASFVASVARMHYLRGNISDSFQVLPFYLRKSSAEQAYDKKKK